MKDKDSKLLWESYVSEGRDSSKYDAVLAQIEDLVRQKIEHYPELSQRDAFDVSVEDLESQYSETGDDGAISILRDISAKLATPEATTDSQVAYKRARIKRDLGMELTDEDQQALAHYEDNPSYGSTGNGMNEETHDQFSNKFRGPGAPGVNLAKGFLLQALELINDRDVHLCADAEALETTIGALQQAIEALSHDKEEVPGSQQPSQDNPMFAGKAGDPWNS